MYQLNYLGIILLIFYVSSPISRNAYFMHMQITHKCINIYSLFIT